MDSLSTATFATAELTTELPVVNPFSSYDTVCTCTYRDPMSDIDITSECIKDVEVATATGPYTIDDTPDVTIAWGYALRPVPGGIGAVSHTNSFTVCECGTCARNAAYHGDYVAVEYVPVSTTESV